MTFTLHSENIVPTFAIKCCPQHYTFKMASSRSIFQLKWIVTEHPFCYVILGKSFSTKRHALTEHVPVGVYF